jgi:tripartite-type tricarboxylate transporter receptor subunit TctC
LSEAWGQSVVVDNRPGGNYAVGAQAVARSPADGLTLLVAPDSTVTANPHLISKLPYDPVKDLTPIIVLCRITPVMVINPSLPVQNVQELIALAKGKPGSLNYGSYGIGTYAHLSMEDFKRKAGTDIVHIPYRGAAPATTALIAGDVSMLLLNLSDSAQEISIS